MRKEKMEELRSIIEELKTFEVKEIILNQEDKFLQSKVYNFKLNNGMIIPRKN